eukprot:COSAG01_NODE_4514_length_4962_cov_71.882171_1_plen_43_part_00
MVRVAKDSWGEEGARQPLFYYFFKLEFTLLFRTGDRLYLTDS